MFILIFLIKSVRYVYFRFFQWLSFENRITQENPEIQKFDTYSNSDPEDGELLPNNPHQLNGYIPQPPVYSIGYSSCEYKSESYQFSPSEDDGWISDSDPTDSTLKRHLPNSPCWMTSEEFISYINNLSEFELLNELYSCWLTNKKFTPEEYSDILHHLLAKHSDPYGFTVIFIQRMKKFKMGRSSPCKLCLTALEEMLTGLSPDIHPVLTQTHKIKALEVGVYCPPSILDEICKIYIINSLGVELQCKVMKDLITSNHYKEAIVSITRFGLQSFFSVEELLPPLIATDQINLIERYLGADRNLQIQFIMLLDKLCSPNVDHFRLYSYYKSGGFAKSDTTNNKLSEHQIQRLAGRLIKTYELNSGMFVHFTTAKVSSFTASLLLRYYCGKGNACQIHEKNWIDLLTASVAQREELQLNLIVELARFNDYRIAAYYMKLFNLADKLPEDISHVLTSTKPHNPNHHRNKYTDSQVKFYPLHLPFDCIVMVDSPARLENCQRYISKRDITIGIDAEWLMPLCNFGILRLALLQLATLEFVFLLDMVALTGAVSESQQISFIKSLFHSPHSIKLGFAIDGDLKMLGKTWPCVTHLLANPVSTIDLQKVASNLKMKTNGTTDLQGSDGSLDSEINHNCSEDAVSTRSLFQKTSLNHIVEECFGFPMDKTNQIANWEKRPIRDDMKIYASLDAFCLIELFDYFRNKYGNSVFQ